MAYNIFRYQLALLIVCMLGATIVRAETDNASRDTRLIAKAIDILAHENVILGKSVSGFQASRPTECGWAISVILEKAKNPVETFTTIADTGSYYGLLALYVLDRSKFDAVLVRFRGADKVTIVVGDQIEEMSGEEFVSAFLPKNGKAAFERLQFKTVPDLIDTVKGEPHSR